MKLSPIVLRLRQQVGAFGTRVGGAAELAAAQDNADLAVPQAWVYRLADLAEDSDEIGAGTQAMTEMFGVLVCVSATGDRRAASADDQMDDLRDALLAALKGWEPDDGAHAAFEYRGFTTVETTRARLWRRFDFATLTSI